MWDQAVRDGLAEAADEGDRPPDLVLGVAALKARAAADLLVVALATLAAEQANLWSDLDSARHEALNGAWSMNCNWFVQRIVTLAKVTGRATSWSDVSVNLILDGTYQGILGAAGVPFEEPDMDRVREVHAKAVGHERS